MDMPKPTADHKRLEKLSGIWKGKEKMHPSPWASQGSEAEGTTRGRVALGGFGVVVDYEQTCGANRTFEGHGVYTWDANAKQVVLHWFDSMGMGVDEFRGAWKGERLELLCKNAMGEWRMSADYSKPGELVSRMESSQDGKTWAPVFDGSYRRES